MNYTENYHLPSWAKTDRIQMETFNDMTAKLEAALSAQDKANQTMAEELALRGNCKIWAGSYKGTGQSSPERPNSFTFPERPILALIFDRDGDFMPLIYGSRSSINHTAGSGSERNYLTWSGTTVTWYVSAGPAYLQLNQKDSTYTVLMFMSAD